MKSVLTVVLCFSFVSLLQAQFKQVKRFTTADGLPSNIVYNCKEDDQGFLWICTPAGVARFDGKYFQNYTTQQGVPDNEVLQAVKEKNGRLWISSYRQEAAYFDTIKNYFVNAREDTTLRAFSGTGFSMLSALPQGGVRYYSQGRSVIFRNHQRFVYNPPKPFQNFFALTELSDNRVLGISSYVYTDAHENKHVSNYLLLLEQGKIIDSFKLFNGSGNNIQSLDNGFCMAIEEGRKVLYYHDIHVNPIRCQVDTIELKQPTLYYHISKHSLHTNTKEGGVDAYDLKRKQFLFSFQGDFVINSIYEDRYGDYWVSTRNSGLLYYRKSVLEDIKTIDPSDNHAIYSFCIKGHSEHYFIGLNDNTVQEHHYDKMTTYTLDSIKNPGIVHYLLQVRSKTYAFSEHAGKLNFKHYFTKPFNKNKVINYKCVRVLKDSNLLLCGQSRLDWLNTTDDTLHINMPNFILNTCAAFDKRTVFTGSTDGLRIIHNLKHIEVPSSPDPILRERLTDLCLSKDTVLWAGTSQAGIYAYKNNKVLWKINVNQGLIHDMINKVSVDSRNRIWVGTNAGLSRITLHDSTFTIQNITQLDGLPSNDVNQFYEWHDTMYVVTSRGVTRMPLNISFNAVDIPVALQGVRINQVPYEIRKVYSLNYEQHEISLQFSGVDITGHFKQLEYHLNTGDSWTLLDGNTLNLNLNSGYHQIFVRSVDVNGNRGTTVLQLEFNVATPFWKSAWFWISLFAISQIFLAFFLYKRIKLRQREKLQRDRTRIELASLEQQAFTSLLNPHFIFNALNGLQDFINKADRQHTNRYLSKLSSLIRKSFELAQQSFVVLEEELSNLEQYLDLEQQRHQPSFNYQIVVNHDVDPEDIMLPSMLLQPLVENALIHGKLSADPMGKLLLHIKKSENGIVYIISDNGIGLKKSTSSVGTSSRHKSRGLQLLQKRLDALGELCGQKIAFIYRVPFPDQENKPGHEVEFTLPDNLYSIWQKSRQEQTN
ncbi:MAG: histidine kinase [Chitinophagaceae bacterium]|nr:histidine kinase [Chitinophagaceae bacterium]